VAQDFGDTPGLGDAAHRAKGLLGLEDLADRAEPGLGQVSRKGFEHTPSRRAIAMDAEVGIEVGSEEPRPDQPLVIGGIAGALIATFYYISPTVGESLALTAFVVVAFGGFGSVPGAMVAGLLVGVIQSLSAYLLGPVYKDIVVYGLFVGLLWVRPQGLFGKAS